MRGNTSSSYTLGEVCYHCGNHKMVLSWSPALNDWLCPKCWSVYEDTAPIDTLENDTPMEAYCEKCDKPFVTLVTDPPFICGKCMWLTEDRFTLESRTEKMCVERAIDVYVETRRPEVTPPVERIGKINEYLRKNYDSNEKSMVRVVIDLANIAGVSRAEILRRLYQCQIYDEAVNYVMLVQTEMALEAYQAKLRDKKAALEGKETYYHVVHEHNLKATFCMMEDDPDYTPF
jgi:hypothetical protein